MKHGRSIIVPPAPAELDWWIVSWFNVRVTHIVGTCINQRTNVVRNVEVSVSGASLVNCIQLLGCLNDRLHVQHMNSTWIESNGCMRCWCENGRSRCFAEGCIAPPCENPRQIANVCCPVCDDSDAVDALQPKLDPSRSNTDLCRPLDKCSLVCEYGLARNEQGCLECTCASMSCPAPLCTLKVDRSSKSYCSCLSPLGLRCGLFTCEKHCPYKYSIDIETGCPQCQCNPCPTLVCTKNCTFGLKRNEVGCSICVCESKRQAISVRSQCIHGYGLF
jgi:hypothetical protein